MTATLNEPDDQPEENPYLKALRDPETYEAAVQEMVMLTAPGLTAIVQEPSDSQNARVAAWAMTFPTHVEVISTEGNYRASLQNLDHAATHFAHEGVTARTIQVAPNNP
ncbi:hypothetical protein [Actinosynnema sp. NPDC020468]|uniref:hypothetical protein n=1 Tax=Actinosynnema sp. NPDC020468 TaxID=3154488 RepID=UPI0034068B75